MANYVIGGVSGAAWRLWHLTAYGPLMRTSVDGRELARRLAVHVRDNRDRKKWSQEEAAYLCGLGLRILQRVEGAQVMASLTTIARLAAGFGVDATQLLAATDKAPAQRNRGRPSKGRASRK